MLNVSEVVACGGQGSAEGVEVEGRRVGSRRRRLAEAGLGRDYGVLWTDTRCSRGGQQGRSRESGAPTGGIGQLTTVARTYLPIPTWRVWGLDRSGADEAMREGWDGRW